MSAAATAVAIEEFKPMTRNTLCGFARVRMPSGLIFHDVAIHQKDGSRWASPASKPIIGRDGSPIMRGGKAAYQPIISFATKEARDRFSASIISAIEAMHPEAFR